MREAWNFLCALGSGDIRISGNITEVRKAARDIVKHFPLGGDLGEAAKRYAPELLGRVEREANQLAQEAACESKRADAAEKAPPKVDVSDALNIP
jgi:hypothetical protein